MMFDRPIAAEDFLPARIEGSNFKLSHYGSPTVHESLNVAFPLPAKI